MTTHHARRVASGPLVAVLVFVAGTGRRFDIGADDWTYRLKRFGRSADVE